MAKQSPLPQPRARVFVVDDFPLVRQGFAQLINREPDLVVCGEAENVQAALQSIPSARPDVVIVGFSMQGAKGIDLVKAIHAANEKLPTLVLSMDDESLHAERALRAGAKGFVMKREETTLVFDAIRRVLSGEIYVSEKISRRILKEFAGGHGAGGSSPEDILSDRELEVFRLIGQGSSTREIAVALRLSIKTVESYRAHIKEKLNLRNAIELARRAFQWVESESR